MTRRRNPFLVLALFACLMQCQSGHTQVVSWPPGPVDSGAEFRDDVPAPAPEPAPALITTPTIEVPALTPLGEPIEATLRFDPPANSLVKVQWESSAKYIAQGNWELYLWAKPGTQTLSALVVVVVGEEIEVYRPAVTYVVGDPPPPEPPKPLIQLVTPEQAPLLAGAYNALAQLADSFTSEAHFWANHDAYLQAKGLLGHGATEAIKLRLSPWDKATLGGTLAAISKEFGEPPAPPVPPVVEGKRAVVILRETEDNTPAIGLLTTELRTGEVANYLKANGHTLDILDDDNPAPIVQKLTALGVQEPALFILDATTSAVIHQQVMPTSAAEIMAVLKAHGG